MKKKELTDIQTQKIVRIIDLVNKLSKVCPQEYKNRLYEVKHYILEYILLKKRYLVTSVIPKINIVNGEHKLLEIVIGDYVFHVPYDRKKKNYGFDWNESVTPELYTKEEDIPNYRLDFFDVRKVFKSAFQLYVHLNGGIGCVKSGTIKYWYTLYVMRRNSNNQYLNLVSCGKNSVNDVEKPVLYKLTTGTGKIIEKRYFRKFFGEAKKSYCCYFKQSINDICNEYEQKFKEASTY